MPAPRQAFLLDPRGVITEAIGDVLRRTLIAGVPAAILDGEGFVAQIANHAWERHNFAIEHVVPWLERAGDLAGQTVVWHCARAPRRPRRDATACRRSPTCDPWTRVGRCG